MAPTLICPYMEEPIYGFFRETVPPLMYYTNVPAFIGALFLGSFIFFGSKRSLQGRVFLALSLFFATWIFCNIITWTTVSVFTMSFSWTFFASLEVLFFVTALYFLYVFIDKKDISFNTKLVFALLVIPVVLMGPTHLNVADFDLTDCSAMDTDLSLYYVSVIDIIIISWALWLGIDRYRKAKDEKKKQQIAFLTGGTFLFLLLFFIAGTVNGFLVNWGIVRAMYEIELYGIFGVFVFLGLITYLIVRYEAFEVKLIGAQALVWGLWFLMFALVLLNDLTTIRTILVITFALLVAFGVALVKSVKREIEQRKELEQLTNDLADMNKYLQDKVAEQTVEVRAAYEVEKEAKMKLEALDKAKTQFILTTQHHLRTPLTIVAGCIKMLAGHAIGASFAKEDEMLLEKANMQAAKMEKLIDEFSSITAVGKGEGSVRTKETNITSLVEEVVNDVMSEAQEKGVSFGIEVSPEAKERTVVIDAISVRNALFNVLDNAVKYTPKEGSIHVRADVESGKYRIVVEDTGIGMIAEELSNAFTQAFQRGEEAQGMYATGRGIGLVLTKGVIESHGGTIRAESEGRGKGTRIIVELPVGKE